MDALGELAKIAERLTAIEQMLSLLLRAQAWGPVHDAHARREQLTARDRDGEFTGNVLTITRSGFLLSAGSATRAFAWGEAAIVTPPMTRPLVDVSVAPR